MNNIKNNVFCLVFFFLIQMCQYGHAYKPAGVAGIDEAAVKLDALLGKYLPGAETAAAKVGVEATSVGVAGIKATAKILADGSKEVTKMLADGSIEITKTLVDGTIEVTKILADGTKEASTILADGAVAASAQFGIESVKIIAEVADSYRPVAWAVVAIAGTYEGWCILGDVKNNVVAAKAHLCPSNKDAGEDLRYEEEYKKLKAKKDLRASLVKNAQGKRGPSGIPVACEEDVRKFAMAGGEDEVEKITETFKKYYGECPC